VQQLSFRGRIFIRRLMRRLMKYLSMAYMR
jgi:hypothetical protein